MTSCGPHYRPVKHKAWCHHSPVAASRRAALMSFKRSATTSCGTRSFCMGSGHISDGTHETPQPMHAHPASAALSSIRSYIHGSCSRVHGHRNVAHCFPRPSSSALTWTNELDVGSTTQRSGRRRDSEISPDFDPGVLSAASRWIVVPPFANTVSGQCLRSPCPLGLVLLLRDLVPERQVPQAIAVRNGMAADAEAGLMLEPGRVK